MHELAQRLRHGVRTHDFVGRIGGDEFVAICTEADAQAASTVAERVLELAREPIDVGGTEVRVSVSVGATVFSPDDGRRPTADELLNRADDAMYESKAAGKDQLHVG
ncbi:GGDEF domain-containing protein [Microbacterium sp. C7(2022)]|uniref:GGDEF domain-containing protein n=1 Tax=Microbacterium sp. C7(2022) TaxID=2992759 RepID=UPI00237BBE17|nr:GGDEF domain-containing protein [Microbacterium sp. C7(2022)]MDE0547632.1 GGDEF domain-containing protein [Microbacterium sp. C7(2022)]